MDGVKPVKRPLTLTVNALLGLTTVNTVNAWPNPMIHKGSGVNDER